MAIKKKCEAKALGAPVRDHEVSKGMTVGELVSQMEDTGGFSSRDIASAVSILLEMEKDKGCLKFLSFPACIMATGTRGILKDMVKRRLFDVVITTCGTLDHDLARIWKDYHAGHFLMDDAALHREGVNRLGNVLVPNESYGIVLEQRLQPILKDIYEIGRPRLSTRELIKEVGLRLVDHTKDASRLETSLVYWAAKNDIPIYVPGITDGAFGSQIWMFRQEHKDFVVDVFADEEELAGKVFGLKTSGALIIGGGISKHHTIWWNQFKDGLDYAVYLTTALEFDGSLSGARVREAVSWGKVKEEAKTANIDGEATAILPMIYAALLDRL
jgi:deoxyhypusine synthase